MNSPEIPDSNCKEEIACTRLDPELQLLFLSLAIAQYQPKTSGTAQLKLRRRAVLEELWNHRLEASSLISLFDHLPSAVRNRAEQLLKQQSDENGHFVSFLDPQFPPALRMIPDPPFGLFYRGNLDAIKDPPSGARKVLRDYPLAKTLAIVGTRTPSRVGLDLAFAYAYDLSLRGISIVSGFALGIDTAAHEGAIAASETLPQGVSVSTGIAVLGGGFRHLYPQQNRKLMEYFIEQGGLLLSEYEPDKTPERYFFPERNRIVSGLSRAVLVVEAAKRSGALVTARLALEQGREVFAIPGAPNVRESEGPLALIKDGAGIVTDIQDLLRYFGIEDQELIRPTACSSKNSRYTKRVSETKKVTLSPHATEIFERACSGAQIDIDTLPHRMSVSTGEVLAALSELEIAGFVARDESGAFILLK